MIRAGLVGLALLATAPAQAECWNFGKTHRFDDKVDCLADPAKRDGPIDPIKFIPLDTGGDAYLSLGGELRERVEAVENPDFGLRGVRSSDILLHRLLLNADLHIGPHFRTFVQIGNHLATNRPGGKGPTDEDQLDLQQGFAEFTGKIGTADWSARAGRQEIALGSQRLVTVREGPNVRLAFDGVRVGVSSGRWRVDGLYTQPVALSPGVFNDKSDAAQALWGVYATRSAKRSPVGLDLYYLGLRRNQARFDSGSAREVRHSLGTRLFGAANGVDWDVEGVWQFGSFGTRRIGAWTVASTFGYTIKGGWAPRFNLSANIASGDHNRADGNLGTFNALFPRAPYFTEASINAPANFFDLHPGLDLKPSKRLLVRADVDFLWRDSVTDAFYRQPIVPLIAGTSSTARYIGSASEVRMTFTANHYLTANLALVHFEGGAFVRAAGGRNQNYLAAWTTLKF